MKNEILFLDLETTGTDSKIHDILSIGAMLWVKYGNFEYFDSFEVYIKSKRNFWSVDPKALKYNGYNLLEHDKIAVSYKEGIERFHRFIVDRKRCNELTICGGINVDFDLSFLPKTITSLFSYRKVDLTSILIYLDSKSVISLPSDVSPTKWAFEKYVINYQDGSKPKSPLEDVRSCVKLYNELLEL